MQIRRPLAALMAALAIFGGGATMTACSASGTDQNDGTTDDDSGNRDGSDPGSDEQDNLPDNSNEEDQDDEHAGPVLDVEDLTVSFPTDDGLVEAVRGGGSGIAGPGALAGTIELDSAGPAELRGLTGTLAYGSRDSIDVFGGLGTTLGGGFAGREEIRQVVGHLILSCRSGPGRSGPGRSGLSKTGIA